DWERFDRVSARIGGIVLLVWAVSEIYHTWFYEPSAAVNSLNSTGPPTGVPSAGTVDWLRVALFVAVVVLVGLQGLRWWHRRKEIPLEVQLSQAQLRAKAAEAAALAEAEASRQAKQRATDLQKHLETAEHRLSESQHREHDAERRLSIATTPAARPEPDKNIV